MALVIKTGFALSYEMKKPPEIYTLSMINEGSPIIHGTQKLLQPPTSQTKDPEIQSMVENFDLHAQERLNNFSEYVAQCIAEIEPNKYFAFPHGMYPPGDYSSSSEIYDSMENDDDYDTMKKRDKEISEKLKRIKALAFVLESEQNTIRKKLCPGKV